MSISNKFENGLFIFRRDLRVIDNLCLNLLAEMCNNIYTIFIFTPEQVGNANDYKSNSSVQFMIESLENLSFDIKKHGGHLHTFYGNNRQIIGSVINKYDIEVIGFNVDISPYAISRDKSIIDYCEKHKVEIIVDYDYYLHHPGMILNGTGDAYQKFTPYYEKASKVKVENPMKMKKIHFSNANINVPNKITLNEAMGRFTKINPNIFIHGGRQEGLKTLSNAVITQGNYSKTHNDVSKETTKLSAYIKFGCVSIREVYYALHSKKDIIRQLFWRDFYANILYHYPHVLGDSMKSNYNKIRWQNNNNWFQKWCDGKTGVPIVDAGMRQLNETGYCHNRARLIVASYLIKTLLIDWRKGEKYFASNLIDYDPASNNGNWQWCAGSGADSQPYFRIFNPYRQTETYDPDCEYIKRWVPELKDVPAKDILKWDTEYIKYKETGYPKPIVNYEEQKEKALKMYNSALH